MFFVGMLGPATAPLVLSVALPLLSTLLLLHLRRLFAPLIGLTVAFAAAAVVESTLPTIRMSWMPWWTIGPWLCLQTALLLGLAALVAKPSEQR
jgi:hypothetical protein